MCTHIYLYTYIYAHTHTYVCYIKRYMSEGKEWGKVQESKGNYESPPIPGF